MLYALCWVYTVLCIVCPVLGVYIVHCIVCSVLGVYIVHCLVCSVLSIYIVLSCVFYCVPGILYSML